MYKWCSDHFSTLWENPSEEDMNKSQELTVFHGRYEIKARKVMVDFKFDALYS